MSTMILSSATASVLRPPSGILLLLAIPPFPSHCQVFNTPNAMQMITIKITPPFFLVFLVFFYSAANDTFFFFPLGFIALVPSSIADLKPLTSSSRTPFSRFLFFRT